MSQAAPRVASNSRHSAAALTWALAWACAPAAPPSPATERGPESIALYFTETVPDASLARRDSTRGALEQELLADLGRATRSIDAALYSLNRWSVVEALLGAAARGASVRVVTECENRVEGYREFFDALAEGGVSVVDDGSSFRGQHPSCPESGGSMHHKFLVVDGRTVWMGSTNMTWSGLNYNENHALRIDSVAVARTYRAEFERLVSGSFGRDKLGGGVELHDVGGVALMTAFSPYAYEGVPDTQLMVLDALRFAESSIRLALFYFTDEVVRSALVERGDVVQGMLDATGAAHSSSQHRTLCAAGVPVTIENFPGKLHHKFAVFDAEGGGVQAQAILGSANWTDSGFFHNDESMLLVLDEALAGQLGAEYERLMGDPVNAGLSCCEHSAEAANALSPRCGAEPCVCADGLDNDHDGAADVADGDCGAAFECEGDLPGD